MRLFVVGKLGEVIKKILELEDLVKDNPKDNILLMELTSYQKILTMWPIQDKQLMDQAVYIFKLNIEKMKIAEHEMRVCSHGDPFLHMVVGRYTRYLDNVRSDLATLNELGMHIGPSPFMEIIEGEYDANMAQTQIEHTA